MKMKSILAVLALLFAFVGGPAVAGGEHEASGVIKAIDKSSRTLKISHGPIKTMGMGAMTMSFKVSSPAMLMDVKTGQKVNFVVTTNRKGEFVIVDLY